MAGKELFPSRLDAKTPTHLDHLGPLVTRISLFHCLGATSENMLEKTPVRPATQEILTQRNESGEIND